MGTEFITDVQLFSLRVDEPLRLHPGMLATEIALRTLSEAIAKASSAILQLEVNELQGEFRAALTPDGQNGLEVEIYLYDTLPGGAGFSRRAGERGREVLEGALSILSDCTCDQSCYRCLRSYKNKFEHDRLDRFVARDLLRYLLMGTLPELPDSRTEAALNVVAEDVARQGDEDVTVERNKAHHHTLIPLVVGRGSRQVAVVITHPLTPQAPANDELRQLAELPSPYRVKLVHELRVQRNLPGVTREILSAVGLES